MRRITHLPAYMVVLEKSGIVIERLPSRWI